MLQHTKNPLNDYGYTYFLLDWMDGDFKQVREEILTKEPIPKLEECYALV